MLFIAVAAVVLVVVNEAIDSSDSMGSSKSSDCSMSARSMGVHCWSLLGRV